MLMTHPGLPSEWVWLVLGLSVAAVLYRFFIKPVNVLDGKKQTNQFRYSLFNIPVLGFLLKKLTQSAWTLLFVKSIFAALFLLIIVAGLSGTPIPEKNIATVFTWNLWWAGIVFAILFVGTGWCAVCPWDTLASWLVKRRIWAENKLSSQLNLTVPPMLRNVWPATLLLCGFTWFELGAGVTVNPYATAQLALLMVLMATVSLALFEKKAFCRYFCPVGRTIGAYSQLSPIELRTHDTAVCENCTTLACYHGNEHIEPCPSKLTIGRLKESAYCTSCGNCALSCPDDNVAWRARPISVEAIHNARPHFDESFFMLVLLGITVFHGFTMLPVWQDLTVSLAQYFNHTGGLLFSFSILMVGFLAVFLVFYYVLARVQNTIIQHKKNIIQTTSSQFKKTFNAFSFSALPLSFSYHLAHNLNHLSRESSNLTALIKNPLGVGESPLSMMEKHHRHETMWLSQDTLFLFQAGLMFIGFWIAFQVVMHRGAKTFDLQRVYLLPMIIFIMAITGFNLWMLSQPMIMRM